VENKTDPSRNPENEAGTHDLVVVANRLPVRRVGRGTQAEWKLSPGGLVSALMPVLAGRNAAWAGWSGIAGPAPRIGHFEGIDLRSVPLSRGELDDFYYGFSNGTLWPLYHDAIRWPEYHRQWWYPYRAINERFARAAASLAAPGGTVWVHDYHLQLVPAFLRELRPDLRIGFFLHVPFPPQELFAQLPWRREILEGLLGADLVGFQTRAAVANFAVLARRYTGARGSSMELGFRGRRVRLGAFPVAIDVKHFESLARTAETAERVRKLHERLGPGRKILLGVDRLDFTKGIDVRLRAFQELLSHGNLSVEQCVLVQTAVPSRERVVTYADLKKRVEMLVGQINGQFADVGRVAVHYLHRDLSPEELIALYRAADVMVVTPLRDGMNLVAKEYVATRFDETGVLVLSEFTGAAEELGSALLVNPHDIDGLAATLNRALRMPKQEVRRRMRRARAAIQAHDVHDWGRAFLQALEA